jgi:YVTN family beta-propeller protein
VTHNRVYVPNAYGSEVWAIDRRDGRLLQTIPVGRHPAGIVLGGTG